MHRSESVDGATPKSFLIFGAQTQQYRHVNQCWQALSLLVDLLTILTVLDVCLQDELRYPHFLPKFKAIWIRSHSGWVRVLTAWCVFIICAVPIIWLIFLTGPKEDQISAPVIFGGSDEVIRSIGAGLLVFVDLLVTVQDWDFPTFAEPLEIQVPTKVLGTFHDKLKITFLARFLAMIPQPSCKCWKSLCQYLPSPEFFQVSICGKWLQYGPLCVVMFIDLCYSRTQLFYDPSLFGQYVDPRDSFVWSITDQETLAEAYDNGYLKEMRFESKHLSMMLPTAPLGGYTPNFTKNNPHKERFHNYVGASEPNIRNVGQKGRTSAGRAKVKLNSRFVNTGIKYLALWISAAALISFACCICTADWKRARILQEIKREEATGGKKSEDEVHQLPAEAAQEVKEDFEAPPKVVIAGFLPSTVFTLL
eukprot:symbB.v1.2.024022.t1/scaffold2243.1/size84679/3